MVKPRYKVAEGHTFFDNWQMHQAGAEVDYTGEPGENLEPINAEAKAAKARVGKIVRPKPLDEEERAELEALRAFKAQHEKAA